MAELDAISQAAQYAGMLEQSRRLSQEKKQKQTAGATAKKSGFQGLLETQTHSEFSAEITDIPGIAGLSTDEALTVLKDELDRTGDNLKADGALVNYISYKIAVKNFMKFMVASNYELEEIDGIPRKNGTKKLFFLVKTVDEKLDRLAAEVLSNHADTLLLLAKIDEINGLLIDLLS